MELNVYSVFDDKAKVFSSPFLLKNDAMAQRVFSDCINSPGHPFHNHAADYSLFQLSTFDDVKGVFTPVKGGMALVCIGLQVKAAKVPDPAQLSLVPSNEGKVA